MKMHESCDLIEKERVKETSKCLRTNTLERFVEENDKKRLRLDRSKKSSEKSVSKVLKIMKNT